MGLAASVALHVLLVGSVVVGAASRPVHRPNREGAGASAVLSSAEPVMTMILINDPGVVDRSKDVPEPVASRGFAPSNLPIRIASPDPLPATSFASLKGSTDEHALTVEANGDSEGRALLFGRYMGQISARIERAWIRPRDAIDDSLFRCRVQIEQSRQGEVKSVTLQDCNGNWAWQRSLTMAIQSASPLPAPPDPSVFADALTLTFNAEAYRQGKGEDGFEPVGPVVASYAQRRDELFKLIGLTPTQEVAPAAPVR